MDKKDQFLVAEMAELIDLAIANIAYPVGMGCAPNPKTTKRLAEELLRTVRDASHTSAMSSER